METPHVFGVRFGSAVWKMDDMENIDLRFTIYIEKAGGACAAYCLEMGLVAVADSAEELPSIMSKLIIRQVEFALKNNNPADIYRPDLSSEGGRIELHHAVTRSTVCNTASTPNGLRSPYYFFNYPIRLNTCTLGGGESP